jgi:hypothetical protein
VKLLEKRFANRRTQERLMAVQVTSAPGVAVQREYPYAPKRHGSNASLIEFGMSWKVAATYGLAVTAIASGYLYSA